MNQDIDNKIKYTGAEIFVKCLEAEGIDLVFGYPGGAVLHIYDRLLSKMMFHTYLLDMSRAQFMPPKVMRNLQIRLE